MGNTIVENRDGVCLVSLDRKPANAIDLDLVLELRESLRHAGGDPAVRAIVLTSSSGKFFCIGFDIPSLIDLPRNDFAHFYTSFNTLCIELYTFQKPAIAAVTGHATAGGFILALCCDYRFVAAGRKLMGVNEIRLGVPVPYPADCMLRRLVGAGRARKITDTGNFFDPRESLELGLVDEIVGPEDLIVEAAGFAGEIGALSHDAFAVTKKNRTAPVTEEIDKHRIERETVFLDLWYDEPARTLLRKAIKKF